MEINKSKIKTLNENDEPTPMDKADERVEAEMKRLEGKTKEQVADGLNDKELARKGRRMKEDAEGELEQLRKDDGND
ncbi:MAG TPA: hypothetical protein VIV66_12790 [Pyrinomonadaceae bacterium]